MRKDKFTPDDFLKRIAPIKRLGSVQEIMKMISGMSRIVDQMGDLSPEDDMRRIEGIINSMTLKERQNPDIIDRGRRHRIATGSGVRPMDVKKLLKDFSACRRYIGWLQ